MPLIDPDSPLRRLPQELNRKQTLFLDGIRITVEAADLSYTRLLDALRELATRAQQKAGLGLPLVAAVADAWAVVDALHRLRILLHHTPGLKQNSPGLQVFCRATSEAEGLRHSIQHLDSHIQQLLELSVPAWGSLQWLMVIDAPNRIVRTCTIASGTLFNAMHPVQNPAGMELHDPIDHVLLSIPDHKLNLSDAMRRVAALARALEHQLQGSFKAVPMYGSDMVVTFDFVPD